MRLEEFAEFARSYISLSELYRRLDTQDAVAEPVMAQMPYFTLTPTRVRQNSPSSVSKTI